MKSRETKQKDLNALTESLQSSKSAMVISFTKLTVTKDQEFRNSLREAGAKYQVVKNTLARIAVKGTDFEQATEHFKGVTALAWTENDPVILSKAISKFMKDNADIYTFKSGVVDGKLVDLKQLTTIANLPSKEELISKLLFVLNAQAQRIVTVISAVPRDLAIVIKQIGEKAAAGEVKVEEVQAKAPALAEEIVAEAKADEAAPVEEAVTEAPAETPAVEVETVAVAEDAPEEEGKVAEVEAAPPEQAVTGETAETPLAEVDAAVAEMTDEEA